MWPSGFDGTAIWPVCRDRARRCSSCRGRPDTESTLARWMPELPAWAASVRVRHLMHHTSGLPDVALDTDQDRTARLANALIEELTAERRLCWWSPMDAPMSPHWRRDIKMISGPSAIPPVPRPP
nr:serine hydrolase [Nonomuraea sp. K271]